MAETKSKKADIVSVAKAAKVSASTVSRYFNHPELLKPTTRRRIERAVQAQGYIRNRAAQTIHGIRSGTIGVLVPTIDHAIFAEVVQAFSDTVAEEGFTILLASHGYDQDSEYAILRKFLEHRVDGVALTGLDHNEAVFQLIDSQSVPTVLMWNYAERSVHPSVGASNEMAGQLIANHVLSLGHRDIACMFAPVAGNDRAKARRAAILHTLSDAGVTVPEPWLLTTVYSIAASKRDAIALLQSDERPSALICGNDILATGALYAAMTVGLSVPEDITIVGIGDFKGSAEIEPALTTVRLPARRIGRSAGLSLAQAIKDPSAPRANVQCAPELVVRRSCRPL
ncbi:LacI family transcriptional regulator [Litoreibacter ponti]|uniref:LacI family transcriptional regulator n=1 Tax=Litoreibacter ponti TaxID=1510457 RepID=A0A2T6BM17_9RHOB|nr:substrate-binding domain-containing protein [Litoreibacter ponti]PTX57092.1 LacI family transcriptional regulator [Litoreibacter ponti]